MEELRYPELYENGLVFAEDYDIEFIGTKDKNGKPTFFAVRVPLTPENAFWLKKSLLQLKHDQ